VTKRVLLALAATAIAASVAGSASARGGSLRVVQAKAPFPNRSLILSLPDGKVLRPGQVTVLENGDSVHGLSVLPAEGAGGNRFGTVLVLDASNSMRGAPIRAAMGAARAFAARRNPGQPLAVVTFNDAPNVVLGFTTNDAAIQAALANLPKLGEGTHIYDAVVRATALLRARHISPGSIVLLSDGKDTGSRASLEAAVREVGANRVRVFSVGLRSAAYDASSLETLADKTQGSYTEATSAESLAGIYDALGLRLATEYLVTYRSRARLGSVVHVSVSVAGIHSAGKTGYLAPALPKERGGTYHHSFGYRLWKSSASMLLAALLVGGLVALAAMLLVRPPNRTLRRRMSEFVSLANPELQAADPKPKPQQSTTLFRHAEKPLEGSRRWAQFKRNLEISEVQMPAVQIVLWTVVATVIAMWLIATVTGVGIFAFFALAIPWSVRSVLKRKLLKRREAFADQLPDNLQVIASGLRAGHSLVGALALVVEESDEPSQSEFRRVIADEQLGVPLEDAIEVVVERMDNNDLKQVALVAALQRRTGGSAAEVIDRVTETIRERAELRRLVKGLTAQGRLSRWIVSLLPPALMGVISVINPHYLDPLFRTGGGRMLLLIGTVMVVSGSLVIKKIVEIKV
jgi:Flp pilus assembly protein TadB/Mg-chelatase subunit ChlD